MSLASTDFAGDLSDVIGVFEDARVAAEEARDIATQLAALSRDDKLGVDMSGVAVDAHRRIIDNYRPALAQLADLVHAQHELTDNWRECQHVACRAARRLTTDAWGESI